jgi:hypothetical protein
LPRDDHRIELTQESVPLENIAENAAYVIEMYGGQIESSSSRGVHFVLPQRRGVAAAGGVSCQLSWSGAEAAGVVTLLADHDVAAPRFSRILLLVTGVIGSLLWLAWPFYPPIGPLAWIGGAIAFATYFLTVRKASAGTAADLLQRIVTIQREPFEDETGGPGDPPEEQMR